MPGQPGNMNALKTGRRSKRIGAGIYTGLEASRPELAAECAKLERQLLAELGRRQSRTALADQAAVSAIVGRFLIERLALARLSAGNLDDNQQAAAAEAFTAAAEGRQRLIAALLPPETPRDIVARAHRMQAEQRSTATDETDSREHDLETK